MKPRMLLIAGLLLLLISLYAMIPNSNDTYDLQLYGDTPAHITFRNQKIKITDAYGEGRFLQSERKTDRIRILINARDYSDACPLEIQPFYHSISRYGDQLCTLRFEDKSTGSVKFALVKSCKPGATGAGDTGSAEVHYRVLFVDEKGKIVEEDFSASEIAVTPYRDLLVRSLGWSPTLGTRLAFLYPVFYPRLTALAGIGLIGFWFSRNGRHLLDRKQAA